MSRNRNVNRPIEPLIPGRPIDIALGGMNPDIEHLRARIDSLERQNDLLEARLDALLVADILPVAPAAYTVANPTTDRALDVTGDTVAQGLAVLGTLIADLQGQGVLG